MAEKTIPLVKGFKIKNQYLKKITVRDYDVNDMAAAEEKVPSYNAIAFKRELIAYCTVKIEGFDGVVTPNIIGTLNRSDWGLLVKEFDAMGDEGKLEDEPK